MKILDLHIDGFGKLVDYSYKANPGMNLFVGENEYGKSTILAFIRAMLYGFSRRGGGHWKEFDRRKYTPWNHFAFGGSMSFLHEGTIYRLERSFGASRAADKTDLSVQSTGTRIDLASEEPGYFLLRLDESEFVNTVYIGQLASPFARSGRDPDVLSSRLINLSQSGDENISFEEVDQRLLAESVRIKAARGPGGILPRLIDELEANRSLAVEAEEMNAEAASKDIAIREKRQEEGRIFSKQTDLQNRIAKLRSRSEQIRLQQREAEVELRAMEEQKDLYIEWMAEREREAREHRRQRTEKASQEESELKELEACVLNAGQEILTDRNRFAAKVRDLKSRIRKQQQNINEMKKLIDIKATDIACREEEIQAIQSEIKRAIGERDNLMKLRMRISNTYMPGVWLIILFLVMTAVAFFTLLYLKSPWFSASLILIIPAVVLLTINRIQLGRISQTLILLIRDFETRLSVLQTIKETAAGYEDSLRKERQTQDLLERNMDEIRQQRIVELQMSRRMSGMTENRLNDLRGRMKEHAIESADDSDSSCPDTAAIPIPDEISAVREINSFEARIQGIRDRLSIVEEESQRVCMEISGMSTEEQILSETITDIRIAAARLETARDTLQEQIPGESRLQEERDSLRWRINRMTKRYEALSIARETLRLAYSDMEHGFAPLVNERTADYLSSLTDNAYCDLRVDREFSVELMTGGQNAFRSLDHFSGGTVDQLYFSLRLAIGDMIRQSDTYLPLLLDDTFVQYDDKRARAALCLLHRLTDRRQVFLFTCQNRMREIYDEVMATE